MKKIAACLAVCLTLLLGKAAAAPLRVNGTEVDGAAVYHQTTYVPLRAVATALDPGASVAWRDGRARVDTAGLSLSARPGDPYIEANGRVLYVPYGVKLENGVTLVPVRVLGQAMGADVHWDATSGAVEVAGGGAPLASGVEYYDADSLYWLSRIISAESRGEPFQGQVAVGNVVLNRVASSQFPDTIYGVIFDARWGGQFEPVRNGSIYDPPAEESVTAAKLCLEGVDVAGGSLYFLAPALTNNYWMMDNRVFVMTIGSHWFYR